MPSQTFDFVFKGSAKGFEDVTSNLKKIESQANSTREKMEKLANVGSKIGLVGGAILAPFGLAMKKYLDVSKATEAERLQVIESSTQKINELEKERADVVQSTGEKIKAIDESIAANRSKLADISRQASDDLQKNYEDLLSNLRDLRREAGRIALDYKRSVEDVISGPGTKKEKEKELKRLAEDYAIAMAEIRQKQAEARRKAEQEERRIQQQRLIEEQKIAIENKKLQEQKTAAQRQEQQRLKEIADAERKAMQEKQAAQAKFNKTYSGVLELTKKWEDSQARIGKVTTQVLIPAFEMVVSALEKVAAFAEKYPGAVKAAIGIGGTLVALAGIVTTTAQLVAAVSTLQGLAASAGLASAGGGAAAGAAGGAASAIGASVTAGLSAFFANVFVPIMALAVGAQIGLWFGNWLTGTNQTWGDILETVKMLPSVIKYGAKLVGQDIAGFIANIVRGISDLAASIVTAISNFGASVVNGIRGIVGLRASGGYVTSGLYAMGERGREFVMNASTTRNAERAIGGPLSQNGAMSYVTNNVNLPSGMTINQVKQIVRSANAELLGSLLG